MSMFLLLLSLASPTFAAEADDNAMAKLERLKSSSEIARIVFTDQLLEFVYDVSEVKSKLRIYKDRLKPVGTQQIFAHLGTKNRSGGVPNIITIKQIDEQEMFDWEVAVSRDLKVVAVACNYRF